MNINKPIVFVAILISTMHISCGGNSESKDSQEWTDNASRRLESEIEQMSADTKRAIATLNTENNDNSGDISEDSNEETVVTSSSSQGSEHWDALLESYEDYIDHYVVLMKKAKSGDLNALMQYAEYMQKATDLQEKIENAKGELSVSQSAKFIKMQNKLLKVIGEM